MLHNYLTAALRNLSRNRAYAILNLFGLVLGFAATILIALFVRQEYSYDRFFPQYQQIYRVSATINQPHGAPAYWNTTFANLAAALASEVSEVQLVARLAPTRALLRHAGIQSLGTLNWADPDFFRLFPFKSIRGDLAQALSQPDGIVLTRSTALQFFGRDAVVGETLELDHRYTLRVTAVIEDLPANTHFSFNAIASGLAPFSRLAALDAQALEPGAIQTEDVYTYVKVYPNARLEKSDAAMRAFADQHLTAERNGIPVSRSYSFHLVPLSAIHLQPQSTVEPHNPVDMKPPADARSLHMMIGIAVLIVTVAASNFVSMMTARATRRAVEVGVRKALGATRSQLIVQFMGECVLYALLALAIAVAAVDLLLPEFNTFLQRDISFDWFHHPVFATALLATAVMIGLAAAVYPALVCSMFGPATVLRGVVLVPRENPARVRQLLVTLQFGTLIALLASTLTIHSQAQYALMARLHFASDQIYVVAGGCRPGFTEAAAHLPGVLTAACVSDAAMEFVKIGTTLATGNLHKVPFRLAPVDGADFFKAFGVVPLAGRLFDLGCDEDNVLRQDSASRSNPSVILNETGARAPGYAAPSAAIGHFVIWPRIALIRGELSGWDSLSSRIIGVVPDLPIGSVRNLVEPMVYYVDTVFSDNIILQLDAHAVAATVRAVAERWAQHSAGLPLEGVFLSQHVSYLYADMRRQLRLFWAFSCVAVVIAALGLLSLASFTAEARTREIGLRKVMGASQSDVLRFLGWQFARPVLWANLIAWPVAYALMQRWLASYAYHVEISLLNFLAAACFAAVLATSTVAGYACLVARSHPAGALRHE